MLNASRTVIVLLLLFQFSIEGMAKKKVAGLVIFRQSNQEIEYLMLKPSKEGKDWSPPKGISVDLYSSKCFIIYFDWTLGQIDDGEDELAAAIRETQEEVGYDADDLDIYSDQQMSVDQQRKNGKNKVVTFFLAKLKATDKVPVLSHEHSEYHWVNKEQASSLYGSHGEFADMFTHFDNKIKCNLLA